jgi:uncharacterized protein
MQSFKQLSERLKKREEEFQGNTLDEAVKEACKFFNCSKPSLHYSILKHGSKGVLGFRRKPFVILARPSQEKAQPISEKHGSARIRITKKGIFLKVTKPEGGAKPVSFVDVQQMIFEKGIPDYDHEKLRAIIQCASGEYEQFGSFQPLPEYDMQVDFHVEPDAMQVFMTIDPPRSYGRILEVGEVVEKLKKLGITHGIKNDAIKNCLDGDEFDNAYIVAEGQEPIHGEDAYMEFFVRIDQEDLSPFLKDEHDRVNYRERGMIQNVTEGQPLAKKHSPKKGKPGYTVYGEKIPAKSGHEIPMPLGRNTRLDENTIVSEITGQAVYMRGVINVEKVHYVDGDVNIKVGNIEFSGTVIVKGNVDDGFSIQASQNIEIGGSVGKARLDAGGNIIVQNGIHGKEGAHLAAGEHVLARFITNATVVAQKDVIASEGILHSTVQAGNRIVCFGRKGRIVGGRLTAAQEIHAKEIGSNGSYTETVLETSTDPEKKAELMELEEILPKKLESYRKIAQNIDVLRRMKESDQANFPADKQKLLTLLFNQKEELETEINHQKEAINHLRSYLNAISEKGCISSQGFVYPGVELIIRNNRLKVTHAIDQVSFVNESGDIRPVRYKPLKDLHKNKAE